MKTASHILVYVTESKMSSLVRHVTILYITKKKNAANKTDTILLKLLNFFILYFLKETFRLDLNFYRRLSMFTD